MIKDSFASFCLTLFILHKLKHLSLRLLCLQIIVELSIKKNGRVDSNEHQIAISAPLFAFCLGHALNYTFLSRGILPKDLSGAQKCFGGGVKERRGVREELIIHASVNINQESRCRSCEPFSRLRTLKTFTMSDIKHSAAEVRGSRTKTRRDEESKKNDDFVPVSNLWKSFLISCRFSCFQPRK